MNFSFTEEQTAVADLAKQIFRGLSTPESLANLEAAQTAVDPTVWGALAKAELIGCALSAEAGGSDLGFMTLCLLLEQAGRWTARVPLIASIVSGALPVDRFGTPEQRERLVRPVATGRGFLSAALPARADHLTVAASRSDTGWTLTGEVSAVPIADTAARVLIPARTPSGDVVICLVDPGSAGITRADQWTCDDAPVHHLTLADADVSDDDVLGTPDTGADILGWTLDHTRVAICYEQLGVAQQALILTAGFTAERKQFGKPIATFQAVSQRAGDAFIDVEAMRLTAWRAGWLLSHGHDATRAISVAKFWAAEGGHRVTAAAQHLHGGTGFDRDYPLFRYTMRSKRLELTLGGAAQHLAALGMQLAS